MTLPEKNEMVLAIEALETIVNNKRNAIAKYKGEIVGLELDIMDLEDMIKKMDRRLDLE